MTFPWSPRMSRVKHSPLASTEKALGEYHECTVKMRELLAKKRSETQANLQPDVRLRSAENKANKLAKAASVAGDAEAAARLQVEEATAVLQKKEAELQAKRDEHKAAE